MAGSVGRGRVARSSKERQGREGKAGKETQGVAVCKENQGVAGRGRG